MTSNGKTSEHRLVMAQKLGRPLKPDEIVHHIDNNEHNNNPKNLRLMTRQEHFWITKRDKLMARITKLDKVKRLTRSELSNVNRKIKDMGLT
jgi:hypothetical protein